MTSPLELRDAAERALADVLGGAREVALVNFPNHGNPGDPALWLGTRALLRRRGVRIRYQAAAWSLDVDQLRRNLPRGAPVLINGGGNFGDLYVQQHETRLRLISEVPDHPLVQLPQSIHYRDPGNAAQVADSIARHGRVTVMTRDLASAELARNLLGVDPVESPDHAFGLAPLRAPRSGVPKPEILWLVWGPDAAEATEASQLIDVPPDVRVEDWHTGAALAHEEFDGRGRRAWTTNRRYADQWDDPRVRARWRGLAATFPPLAQRWVDRGLSFLTGSRVVVTNKLHGHLLLTMLGRPHVVLDNSYGKVLGAVDRWTRDAPGVHPAHDADEALRLARRLWSEAS